ncbi:XRE family transcriptional regulator [Frankia sp. Mgl5]|uniref:XRE family transcriptional regulator n=1 Tax=Frankia sp. Mgl5 TaxID=2933793 RepID=UPI00200EBA35|nr:XRE family transcriptional regulator [Frankia sp. Mgl5]MCK9929308.1 XRE family transcriptional regulator [Frankia sp. Mgl5]
MEPWKREMLALAARITELRGEQGKLPFTQAAKIDRPTLIRVEQGKVPISQSMAEAIDAYCETGGEIERRRRRVEALRAGWPVPPVEEVDPMSPTSRRTLIGGGLFATAATAAAISDRIADAAVAPRTLREIEWDVQQIAAAYPTSPAAALAPRVEEGWIDAERLLDGRVRGRTRTVLDLRAGQYALYLALTANDLGHHAAADTYLDLAGQHADEAGDRLLADCVAILDSSFAFFRNQPSRAQHAAAERRADAHPYARPMLAVCESRAAARTGDAPAARRALEDVWAHLWTGGTLPGTVPVGEDLARAQTAAILSTLADPAAEEHARRAIDVYTQTEQAGMLGGSYNALARTYLRRPEPDPEGAAAAAQSALAAVGDQRTSWVVDVSAQMWRQMDAQWPALEPVRELGQLVGAAERRALPPADV